MCYSGKCALGALLVLMSAQLAVSQRVATASMTIRATVIAAEETAHTQANADVLTQIAASYQPEVDSLQKNHRSSANGILSEISDPWRVFSPNDGPETETIRTVQRDRTIIYRERDPDRYRPGNETREVMLTHYAEYEVSEVRTIIIVYP